MEDWKDYDEEDSRFTCFLDAAGIAVVISILWVKKKWQPPITKAYICFFLGVAALICAAWVEFVFPKSIAGGIVLVLAALFFFLTTKFGLDATE